MKETKIKIDSMSEAPDRFTGNVKVRSVWHRNGKLHRLNGPAVECPDGHKEHWIDGVEYSKEEFDRKTSLIQQQLPKRNTDYRHLTDQQWYEYLDTMVIE